MLIPSWAKSAAGVALAVAALAGGGYCAGRSAGTHAAQRAATKAIAHAADSVTRRTVRDSIERDSLRHVTDRVSAQNDTLHARTAQLTARVAALMHRVRITSPTVIAVDTASGAPGKEPGLGSVRGSVPPAAPPVLVTVPPQVTRLIQSLESQNAAQAQEIAGLRHENTTLRTALAVSDSGWTHEKALRLLREREITVIQSQHSPFGVKTGIVLGVLGTLGAVYAAGRLD